MTVASYRIQAFVKLSVGMKMLFDCPAISMESFEADDFFRKYRGKIATITGFPNKPVGILDKKGRLPGLYLSDKGINVRFEDEEQEYKGLNLQLFVLFDQTTTMTAEEYELTQRVGDLPVPLQFYTGDTVYKSGDLLQEPRMVSDVRFSGNGSAIYVLAETIDSRERRKAERTARIERKKTEAGDDMRRMGALSLAVMPDFRADEPCSGEDLTLISRGNVFSLYNSPEELAFDSPEDELRFWGMDGISQVVYGSGYVPTWEYPLPRARTMLEEGSIDLLLKVSRTKSRVLGRNEQLYEVRRLHDCFAQHREHVRELSRRIEPPEEEEKTADELAASILED